MAAYLKKLFRHNPLVARKPLIRVTKFLRRVADRLRSFEFQTGHDLRAVDDLDSRLAKCLDDLRRGAFWHRKTIPSRCVIAWPSALRDGRQVGQPLRALLRRDGQRPYLAAVDETEDGRDGRDH